MLFNMLSRLVTAFLPKSKHLLISWLPSAPSGAPQNKVSHCFKCFPTYLPCMMGLDAMIFVYQWWVFNPAFSLSSFIFIKRFFSSSLLSAIRAVSSAYMRLLIFLLAILILACASSSPAFLMMYPAYKLNKQGDYIQPWYTPFPIFNQSIVPYPVLLLLDLQTGFSGGR